MLHQIQLAYTTLEGFKLLTALLNSHLAQDTFHAILTAGLLFFRPRIKEYAHFLGIARRERLARLASGIANTANTVGSDIYVVANALDPATTDVSLNALQARRKAKKDITLGLPTALPDFKFFAIPPNHPALLNALLEPPSLIFVVEKVCIVLWIVVSLFGLLLFLSRVFSTINTSYRGKTRSEQGGRPGSGQQGTSSILNTSASPNPSRESGSGSGSSNPSGPAIPSDLRSDSRPPPNHPPNPPSSDTSAIPPALLSILNGTYMNAYFESGGPPPPPPPPSGSNSIVDSSDSDSDYDSDGWRHPHRLRFGARPRVKAHHKHRKSNKHRRTCDAVHALNADPNVNPNQNIQIDIPPGLLLNGDVLLSELEMENEEKMRSLVRFVTMCAGASGASLFVRLVWPPIGKIALSNDMGLSLQDALDVDIISETGTMHSSPFKANLTTILGAGNVATQTARAAMWALNNRTFSFPPGVSAYDFDLAMDMGLVFQSDLDVDSDRGVNALATMSELLQRLLWDGAEDCDVPSQLKRCPDWVNFNLSDDPLARTLASEAEGESCARDSDSGVILCVSSTSSSSISSVTSSSSLLLSSRSTVSTEAGVAEDFIGSVESPGVCPNVPSFYTGCEVYAAFFELEPPTKTSPGVTSVGIGMHIPSTSRLRMFGIRTPPAYDFSRTSTPHQTSIRFTPSILPSLVMSRVSSTLAPRLVEPKAPPLNPESQANLSNSLSTGPSPSTKSAVKPSKPNLPVLAFNVICAIINIFYGLLYSSHGLLPLLILVALFLAFSGGKNMEKPTTGDPVASGTPGGSEGAPRDVNEIDDKDKNVSSQGPMASLTSSEHKRTPAKISPSKLPVSVTRVEVRDVLRRLDLMYENGDTSIFPSDSSSWSSSESASSEAHVVDS